MTHQEYELRNALDKIFMENKVRSRYKPMHSIIDLIIDQVKDHPLQKNKVPSEFPGRPDPKKVNPYDTKARKRSKKRRW